MLTAVTIFDMESLPCSLGEPSGSALPMLLAAAWPTGLNAAISAHGTALAQTSIHYTSTCSFESSRFLSSSFSFPEPMLWPLLSWPRPIRRVVVTVKLVAVFQKDSSDPGYVNDEQCQSYSGYCTSGYVKSCCYTVTVSIATWFKSLVNLSLQ